MWSGLNISDKKKKKEIYKDNYIGSEIEVYKQIKEHIVSVEKKLNYTGARLLPLTFLVGIITPIFVSVFFKDDNEKALLIQFKNSVEDFTTQINDIFMIILYGLLLLLTIIIMFVITVMWIIFLFQSFDNRFRNSIYKISMINEILDGKIKDLEKD